MRATVGGLGLIDEALCLGVDGSDDDAVWDHGVTAGGGRWAIPMEETRGSASQG